MEKCDVQNSRGSSRSTWYGPYKRKTDTEHKVLKHNTERPDNLDMIGGFPATTQLREFSGVDRAAQSIFRKGDAKSAFD